MSTFFSVEVPRVKSQFLMRGRMMSRAGGATRMFFRKVDVERIRIAGRWRNTQTLDHYIQEAVVFVNTVDWGPLIQERVQFLAWKALAVITFWVQRVRCQGGVGGARARTRRRTRWGVPLL